MPLGVWVAIHIWDDDACEMLSERWARFCREAGGFDVIGEAVGGVEPIQAVIALCPEVLVLDTHGRSWPRRGLGVLDYVIAY